MARWNYPRSRRIMMQVVMCLIFCGSVGLAELVTQQRRASAGSQMAAAREFSHGTVRLPAGWVVKRQNVGDILFEAQELDTTQRMGRTLTCHRKQLAVPVPALEFVMSDYLNDDSARLIATGADSQGYENITIGGLPGILLGIKRQVDEQIQIDWIACCVRPSGLVITLVMNSPQSDDPEADKQTLRDIAASIQLKE